MTSTAQDLDICARTIWGEARGQGPEGMLAVAFVMVNRARTDYRGDSSLVDVCTAHRQFSVWNGGDPNRSKMLALSPDDPLYQEALSAVLTALYGSPSTDPTSGARHYHTTAIEPVWAKGKTPEVVIGDHAFYVGIA